MVSELLPLIVTALLALTAAKVRDAHWAPIISTVTVIPELIVTASEDVGTAAPPHVVVLLQGPETEAILVASGKYIGVSGGWLFSKESFEFAFKANELFSGTA